MATETKSRPRVKPARSVSLLVSPSEVGTGVLRITVGKVQKDYFLTCIPSDFGTGFGLQEIGSEGSYHVHLSEEGHRCECKGYLHHGHCKHVDGLAALCDAGQL